MACIQLTDSCYFNLKGYENVKLANIPGQVLIDYFDNTAEEDHNKLLFDYIRDNMDVLKLEANGR